MLMYLATAILAVMIGCSVSQEMAQRDAKDEQDSSVGYLVPSACPAPSEDTWDPGLMPLREGEGDDRAPADWNREAYDHIVENAFRRVADHPLSTFSIDVDTASYANVRRMLNGGRLPPAGAVRIEEMINYFDYEYGGPSVESEHPFAAHMDIVGCPWNDAHRLARIAIKGRELRPEKRPAGNFVFLLDVSGSMKSRNKLDYVRESMKMLVSQLGKKDRVAIAVYAGASGLVLPSTPCDNTRKIIQSLNRLSAGGSTNGGAGIRLAYKVAQQNFITGGVNRVILCTDGDFNVGTTSQSDLVNLIEDKAKSGVFLTVLGFGMGNYQDSTLEKLADKGNGNYGYIDTINEARKMLVEQLAGTMVTIAKDVKIQIEFNPAKVAGYRLVGYENRMLKKEDFNDDTKDAGEIGAGHTVTALYEIVPAGQEVPAPSVDPLKYQVPANSEPTGGASNETLTLKLRYKQPDGDTSTLMTIPVTDTDTTFAKAPQDLKFAAAVAGMGMLLRSSEYKGSFNYDTVIKLASATKGVDRHGYRSEFIQLAKTARQLAAQQAVAD
jgi:Ca-activated chloride channel family protein